MKRIERNTLNHLRKNVNADTINVEVPTTYTHEARQTIHELLTTGKGLYLSAIYWNDIQNAYCLHYERTLDTPECIAKRQAQESADVDTIAAELTPQDYTWTGYPKKTEEKTEEREEPETMKSTDFAQIHVTAHKGKLEGIPSINTSMLDNPICQKRAQDPESVCSKCYAARLLAYRKNNAAALEQNSVLFKRLLTPEEAAAVPVCYALYVRIESFGDVRNVIQARNYLRIAAAHPRQQFGAWTKNPGIWYAAIKREGKPENLSLVYSSPKLNTPAELPAHLAAIVDHVFTVYNAATYDAMQAAGDLRGAHLCAGVSCVSACGCTCYHRGGPRHIAERLRK